MFCLQITNYTVCIGRVPAQHSTYSRVTEDVEGEELILTAFKHVKKGVVPRGKRAVFHALLERGQQLCVV